MSFSFDLHSAAVFDSHLPCHAYVATMPCSDCAVLKATSRHGRGTAWARHAMCEL